MCEVYLPWSSITGSNIVTLPLQAQPWQISASRQGSQTRLTCTTGEWEMKAGDAAETSVPKTTPQNFGGLPLGFQASESTRGSLGQDPMMMIVIGRGVSSRRSIPSAPMTTHDSLGGRSTTMLGILVEGRVKTGRGPKETPSSSIPWTGTSYC